MESVIWVIILTLATKLIGMVREVMTAHIYGATQLTDAFYLIFGTVYLVFTNYSIAIRYALMARLPHYESDSDVCRAVTKYLLASMGISLAVMAALLIWSGQVLGFFAPGFSPDQLKTAVGLLQTNLLSIEFITVANILIAYLQYHSKNKQISLMTLPGNLIMIFCLGVSALSGDVRYFFWSIALSYFAQMLLMVWFAWKAGFRPDFRLAYDKNDGIIISRTLPLIGGSMANQAGLIADQIIGSMLGVGIISLLNYSNRIIAVMSGVFITGISHVILGFFLQGVKTGEDMNEVFRKAFVNGIDMLMLGITFLACNNSLMVAILFGGEKVDTKTILLLTNIYTVGLLFQGFCYIYGHYRVATEKNLSYSLITMMGIVINILLNFWLSSLLGVAGIPLSTVVSGILLMLTHMLLASREGVSPVNTVGTYLVGRWRNYLVLLTLAAAMLATHQVYGWIGHAGVVRDVIFLSINGIVFAGTFFLAAKLIEAYQELVGAMEQTVGKFGKRLLGRE